MKLAKLFLVFAVLAVGAISIQAQRTYACSDVNAFVIDKNPKGLNVRKGPSTKHKKLTSLKWNSMVNIVASKGKWVKINYAEDGDMVLFRKLGWVYAPLLGTRTKKGNDPKSKLVATYKTNSKKSEIVDLWEDDKQLQFQTCRGDWVKIKVKYANGEIGRSWLPKGSYCGNPFTSCS